jgi:hypothetical protein
MVKDGDMDILIKPGDKARISIRAKDVSNEDLESSRHAGEECTYLGDWPIGDIMYAAVTFDNGGQGMVMKEYLEVL